MTGNGFSFAAADSKPSSSSSLSSSALLPGQQPPLPSSSPSALTILENLPKEAFPVEESKREGGDGIDASSPHVPTRLPTVRAVTAETSSTRENNSNSNPLAHSDIAAVDENGSADGCNAVQSDAAVAAAHHNAAHLQSAASAGNVNNLLAAANAHQSHLHPSPAAGSNTCRSRTSGGDSTRRIADDSGVGPSPARDRAKKAAKAAAAARAHYLRTAVDPVFVPLLDAVVFHKPRDVAAFVAERTLRQVALRTNAK